jgi:hypothetical protein
MTQPVNLYFFRLYKTYLSTHICIYILLYFTTIYCTHYPWATWVISFHTKHITSLNITLRNIVSSLSRSCLAWCKHHHMIRSLCWRNWWNHSVGPSKIQCAAGRLIFGSLCWTPMKTAKYHSFANEWISTNHIFIHNLSKTYSSLVLSWVNRDVLCDMWNP